MSGNAGDRRFTVKRNAAPRIWRTRTNGGPATTEGRCATRVDDSFLSLPIIQNPARERGRVVPGGQSRGGQNHGARPRRIAVTNPCFGPFTAKVRNSPFWTNSVPLADAAHECSADRQGRTILIVDDDASIREIERRYPSQGSRLRRSASRSRTTAGSNGGPWIRNPWMHPLLGSLRCNGRNGLFRVAARVRWAVVE